MKKQLLGLALSLFVFPLTASAGLIGTGTLTLSASDPVVSPYLGDYDVVSYTYLTGTKIEFAADLSATQDAGWEAFCVSIDHLNPYTDNFNFYTASEIFGADTNFITWVANWATGSGKTDADKVLGQKAIWQTLDVITGTDAIDYFNGTFSITGDYAKDWLVAQNGGIGIGAGGNQDFLVKASPVPEPTTMLLFGTGIAGLAGIARRKRD